MKDLGIIQGSKEQAVPLIVNIDTVYVHTDIRDISYVDEFGRYIELFQYREVQYDKNEYIHLISETVGGNAEDITNIEADITALEAQLDEADMTAIEMYEALLAQTEINDAQDLSILEIYETLGGN